jgi:hypothetical protein
LDREDINEHLEDRRRVCLVELLDAKNRAVGTRRFRFQMKEKVGWAGLHWTVLQMI